MKLYRNTGVAYHHTASCLKKADGYIGYKDGVTVELIAVPLSNEESQAPCSVPRVLRALGPLGHSRVPNGSISLTISKAMSWDYLNDIRLGHLFIVALPHSCLEFFFRLLQCPLQPREQCLFMCLE